MKLIFTMYDCNGVKYSTVMCTVPIVISPPFQRQATLFCNPPPPPLLWEIQCCKIIIVCQVQLRLNY